MAKKIIMLDIYGMEHIFDNNFENFGEAEQWANDNGYKISRQYTEKTDAEKRAQAKYDKSHKEQFKTYYLKYGLTDPDNQKIIEQLDKVPNKQDYIRNLILADIQKNGI